MEPYQEYDPEQQLSGLGINVIRCIEQNTDLQFTLELLPWKRAQELVKQQKYDGFFVGSENNTRNQYARYFGPFITSYWHWYLKHEREARMDNNGLPTPENINIGVVLGTNMHQWISAHEGYKIIAHESSKHLFELLELDKLDYVLATEPMYLNYRNSVDSELNSLIAKSKPLGVYLGHHFIQKHPKIIKQIENSVDSCQQN
ncbi:hypothetical protein GCM10022277_04440 [Litoribacillus peritrichatus]|uniref:Solute-binding protein family 3/N-terminal domain-containing protein n=2 Tax=Litoribacillus peritrichatus TaxID=718191 RepID=A0ABP7M2S3_9GAMM